MRNLSAIILLFIANSISGIAQGMSMIAIPWYFVQRDLMETFGWIYVLTNVLSFFWVPYCGTLIDKYNRKTLLLIATLVSGLILGSITIFGFHNNGLPMGLVASVFILTFLNYNIHYPNLYAFVQEISEKKWYGRIASFIEIQGQVATVTAGAFAAMLLEGTKNGAINIFGFQVNLGINVEAWKIHEIFAIDAFTYFVALIFIFLIKFHPLTKRNKETAGVFRQLKVGYNYLKGHAEIFLFGVASYSVFVATLIMNFYLSAIYVERHLETSGDVYAAAVMYYSVGAVLAGVAIQWLFRKMSIPSSVVILTIGAMVLFTVLSFTKNIFIFYAMIVGLGLANAGTRIQRITFLFSHVHNQVYGRANSIFFLTNIMLRILFLSLFALPFFHEKNNVVYALIVLSGLLFISALILIKNNRTFSSLEPL